VQAWVTDLTRTQSPASVRKIHRVLSLVLDMAVEDGRLARNVAAKVKLPRPVKHEHRYLTHTQVDDLSQACGYPADPSKDASPDTRANETYRLVVLFLAYTGARFGEMAALKVKRHGAGRSRLWRDPQRPAPAYVDLPNRVQRSREGHRHPRPAPA
jgi:integrase